MLFPFRLKNRRKVRRKVRRNVKNTENKRLFKPIIYILPSYRLLYRLYCKIKKVRNFRPFSKITVYFRKLGGRRKEITEPHINSVFVNFRQRKIDRRKEIKAEGGERLRKKQKNPLKKRRQRLKNTGKTKRLSRRRNWLGGIKNLLRN